MAMRLSAAAAVTAVGAGVVVWQVEPAQSAATTGSVVAHGATAAPAPAMASFGSGSEQVRAAQLVSAAELAARIAANARAGSRLRTSTPADRAKRAGLAPSAAASPSPSQSGAGSTPLTCAGTGGMLPANYATIVDFLVAHGYTAMAAAGIAGNIYQESQGDPESIGSGGGGLIGWTPLPAGYVTGNPAVDLQTQLAAILVYDNRWSQYIPVLNAATSPAEAADIYMNDFERPGLPATANREAAAVAVARACKIS